MEGRRLVGFEFEARRSTIGVIQISEGLRLVGFEFEARRGGIGGVQISEGLRLVGFKYEKCYDWLDSQFHCSHLDSRGVPEKPREKNAGNYLPFISGSRLPVTSFPVMQLPVTSRSPSIPLKCGLSCPYILLT